MGVVYSAIHPVLERNVAIKVLTEYESGSRAVQRFIQEARLVNRIEHPNIVRIFGYGELPEGRPYLVMEHLAGRTLNALIRERAPLSLDEAFPILEAIGAGLQAAHEHGIVHRDLKPQNVMVLEQLGSAPVVKLLDFGIAKLLTPQTSSLVATRTGTTIGSPSYMSPEQCAGREDIDLRTDLYSLGVIAYEMFTGRLPFRAPSHVEARSMHLHEAPTPPSLVTGVPAPLERIILRALQKRPEDRHSSIAAWLAELAQLPVEVRHWRPVPAAHGESFEPPVDTLALGKPGELSRADVAITPQPKPQMRDSRLSRRAAFGLGMLAGAVAMLAIGILLMRWHRVQPVAEPARPSAVTVPTIKAEAPATSAVEPPAPAPAKPSKTHHKRRLTPDDINRDL